MQRGSRLVFRSILAATALAATAGVHADVFVDLGINATRVEADVATLDKTTNSSSGLHIGVGARRALRAGSIGVRAELDDLDGDLLLALRALDYQRNLSARISVGGFFGAARLDLATPAYGYYLGGGVRFAELVGDWDLGVDLRLGDKIARDNLLPSDPQGGRPDNFYDLNGISVYLSRRF
jgi:hypothetical protein